MKKLQAKAFLFLILSILGSSFLYAAHHEDGASAGIAKSNAQWQAALNSGDAAGVAALYTEDGQVLPPNGATQTGRDAIAATFQGFIDGGFTVKLETIELEAHGHSATEVGEATVMDAEGTTLDVAKFIVLWKEVDGEWKFHRDIWNSNTPLPAAPEAAE